MYASGNELAKFLFADDRKGSNTSELLLGLEESGTLLQVRHHDPNGEPSLEPSPLPELPSLDILDIFSPPKA